MTEVSELASRLRERFAGKIERYQVAFGEVTVVLAPENIVEFCLLLKDEPGFEFKQLIDVTAVDYLDYGQVEWETTTATSQGFDRGVQAISREQMDNGEPRFAVVYHLLSVSNNQRLRIKTYLEDDSLVTDSVCSVWPVANWFEREVYDLFGIEFRNHPDLRRILTDYGFVGHPFRKDFPVSGYVEVRYDAKEQRVVYEPVDIEPRVLVPKTIRQDNRYETGVERDQEHG